ncbi:MAG: MarR family winged helix-turn-helix transcriptional regulator [Thermoanaerobaculia bacterium]
MKRDLVVRNLMDSLRRIVRALRSSHRAAGNLDLSGAQLFVIKALGEAGQPLSVNELAEMTGTTQSTVSSVAARLVERKLIKSERAIADARRAELSLTAKGRVLHRKGPSTVAQFRLAKVLGNLPLRDAEKLQDLLALIVSEMGIGEEPAGMMFDDEESTTRATARGQQKVERASRPRRRA